jgi:hypothetical protein
VFCDANAIGPPLSSKTASLASIMARVRDCVSEFWRKMLIL